MGAVVSFIFLISMAGMFLAGVLYFYFLFEFKSRLMTDCREGWSRFSAGKVASGLQLAYQALQHSKDGQLAGLPLSKKAVASRKMAVLLLYTTMILFLVVLSIGLLDSVIQGKN